MELTEQEKVIYDDLKFAADVSEERVKDTLLLYAMTPQFSMDDVMKVKGILQKELGRKIG